MPGLNINNELPPEIVCHILTFVPDRYNAALVCKDFYQHVCTIEKDYYKLNLNCVSTFRFLQFPNLTYSKYSQDVHISSKNQKYIDDLLASRRQIYELSLSEAAGPVTNKVDRIIKKFGGNVKKFNISSCATEKQLCGWLNMMPLLEEISFSHMSIDKEGSRAIPQLNLPKLKKVTFKECLVGEKMNLINAFPTNVIEELWWNNCFQRKKATKFLENQLNIKILTIEDDSLAEEATMNQLNLKQLTINNDFDPPYKMFCRQRNLTSLSLKNVPLNTIMFNIICSMKLLESLKFDTEDGLPAEDLANLEKLPNLKSLTIHEGDDEHLEVFVNLNLPKLEMLCLWSFSGLDNCWSNMQRGFVNIKEVRYGPCFDLGSIENLLVTFPKLVSIKIAMGHGDLVNSYRPNPQTDYTKLKKFYVAGESYNPIFLDVLPFLDACVNLEEIYIYTPLHINFLRHLINSKENLRKLAMMVDERSSKSDEITDKITTALDCRQHKLRHLQLIFSTSYVQLDMEVIKNRNIGSFPIICMEYNILTFKMRGEGSMEYWGN